MPTPAEITRKAKSNLALAIRIMPPDQRADVRVFYAFCRTIDDIADDGRKSQSQRREELSAWKRGFGDYFSGDRQLGKEIVEMMVRRGIPVAWMIEIVNGCEMDLEVVRYQNWEDLEDYIHRVAGVVGLVCTRIFGCADADSDRYAESLGKALQLTNILRDVGEDAANGGRIYLPVNDLIRFRYSERDLIENVQDGRFLAMMEYEAGRARHHFAEAESLIPEVDRAALLPARMMAEIYQSLLQRMEADRFQIFSKRYGISAFRKGIMVLKYFVAARLGPE